MGSTNPTIAIGMPTQNNAVSTPIISSTAPSTTRPVSATPLPPLRPEGLPSNEPPQHEDYAQALGDREEQEEGPEVPHARAADEQAVEHDLQRDEGPQRAHRAVRGRVEREPPLAPPEREGEDRGELEGEAHGQGPPDAEADRQGPDAVCLVRHVVRGGRGRGARPPPRRPRRRRAPPPAP